MACQLLSFAFQSVYVFSLYVMIFYSFIFNYSIQAQQNLLCG